MYRFYASPTTLDEALALKAYHGDDARFLAGGTDLLIELDRGQRHTANGDPLGVIDLTRIPGLAEIEMDGGQIHLGALVTHNQCVADDRMVRHALPLARACWEVGAPQIRNRATVAGNLITASPANDAVVPLLALDARVTIQSLVRGERTVPLAAFVTGFRKVDLTPDEIVTGISFAAMRPHQAGVFIKLGLRRAQAISVVSVAVVVERATAALDAPVTSAAIALGAVAPVVTRATAAEHYLTGKRLTAEHTAAAAAFAVEAATPIDDVRSSAEYRQGMVRALVDRALCCLAAGEERTGWPAHPVLLWGHSGGQWPATAVWAVAPGQAAVNGLPVKLSGQMTLLDSLRAAGYAGVKEGCAEGECGACTVFLDEMAVMACMVPAERAWGSRVTTVEGLGAAEHLHPVQQAFVQAGGVQCGYCTPGQICSAVGLLAEVAAGQPSEATEDLAGPVVLNDAEIRERMSGNICRCSAYPQILAAVRRAAGAAA